MKRDHPLWILPCQYRGYVCAEISALGNKPLVSQLQHEFDPDFRDLEGVPARCAGSSRKTKTGKRRYNHIERVVGIPAELLRIRQQRDDLKNFQEGSWPAVSNDNRQRPLPCSTHMNEVDLQPLDFRLKMRQSTPILFLLPPVESVQPMVSKGMQVFAVKAVCPSRAHDLIRPACAHQSLAQIG